MIHFKGCKVREMFVWEIRETGDAKKMLRRKDRGYSAVKVRCIHYKAVGVRMRVLDK